MISCRRVRSVACSLIEGCITNAVRRPHGARDTGPDDLHLALDPGISILRAGRPVLVVPDEIDSLPARRIMLAWKDTRESRRAVSDALRFLKEATEVLIAEVCEPGSETKSLRSVEDVAVHLRRHGVR